MNEQNEGSLSVYQGQSWADLASVGLSEDLLKKKNALKAFTCLILKMCLYLWLGFVPQGSRMNVSLDILVYDNPE